MVEDTDDLPGRLADVELDGNGFFPALDREFLGVAWDQAGHHPLAGVDLETGRVDLVLVRRIRF